MALRKKIGKRIRELRKQQGLSQQQLAEQVDVSWQHIGSMERADRSMSIEVLERVALALDVGVGELVAADEIQLGNDVEELLRDVPSRQRASMLRVVREIILHLREVSRDVSGRKSRP